MACAFAADISVRIIYYCFEHFFTNRFCILHFGTLPSDDAGESTVFVEFMLATIKASLMDALEMRDAVMVKLNSLHNSV